MLAEVEYQTNTFIIALIPLLILLAIFSWAVVAYLRHRAQVRWQREFAKLPPETQSKIRQIASAVLHENDD